MPTDIISINIHNELQYLKLNPKYKGYQYLYEMIEGVVNHKVGLSGAFISKEVYDYVKPKKPTSHKGIRNLCNNAIMRAYKNNEKLYETYFKFSTRPSVYDVMIAVVNAVVRKRYLKHIR